MSRVLCLTIKGQTIKGIEVARKGASGSVVSFVKDNKDLDSYKGRSLPVAAVLSSPVFIKSIRPRKDQIRNKRSIQEFILQKPPFPLRDSKWDWCLFGNHLTIFVAKAKDVDNTLNALEPLNIQPTFITSKAVCLYNYFISSNPKEKDAFCLLYLASDFLDMLTFAKGRFFFYEIPLQNVDKDPSVLKTAIQELNRQKEYLQFQESVPEEYFSDIFVCGRADSDLAVKLGEGLGGKANLIEDKVNVSSRDSESFALLKDDIPVLLGAALSSMAKGSLGVDFIKQERYKNLLTAYKERLVKLALFASMALLAFLAGMSLFTLNNIINNRRTLSSHEKIVEKLTPIYNGLDAKKQDLLKQIEPLEKRVRDQNFLIEALPMVAKLKGNVEIDMFSFARKDQLELDLDVRALAYDDISEFLKNLRESGYFSKIVPVSSRSATKDVKEEVHFKIKLLK